MSDKTGNDFISKVPAGWIRDYLDTMVEFKNEMPLPFHFLSAATVMGNLIGLRTWATLSKGVKVFPNVNCMLLSPAGRCRRGEGTKLTIRIARRAGVNVFAGKVTPEGLADEMIQNGSTLLYVEELSVLLGKREHQRAVVPFLTKALLHGEGSMEERSRSTGTKLVVPHVNLSMIATTAPDWFITTMPEEAYGGGLMSRYLVCCLEDRDVYHVDIEAEGNDDEKLTELAKSLRTLTATPSMSGQVRVEKETKQWFEKWYYDNEMVRMDDDRMEPHRNRRPANLLRVAILLAVSAQEEVLRKDTAEAAMELLEWLEPTVRRLYVTTDVMSSYMSMAEHRILKWMGVKRGEVLHRDLARYASRFLPGGARELRSCLEGMEEKGLIKRLYAASHDTVQNKIGLSRLWPPFGWIVEGER